MQLLTTSPVLDVSTSTTDIYSMLEALSDTCCIKSVLDNLEELIVFMHEVAASDNGDAGYKAMGFVTQLSKFCAFYVLKLLAKVFSHIDTVNTVIQSKKLDFHQCLSSVEMLRETVNSLRETKLSSGQMSSLPQKNTQIHRQCHC